MNPPASTITIIIPTYRGIGNLPACLDAIKKSEAVAPEIIVVDCETPSLPEWIKQHYPEVRLLHFDQDIGLGRARNEGLRLASSNSEYLAFLDSDTIVAPNWAKSLMRTLDADESIGAIQSCILLAEDASLLDHTGLALDLLGTWFTTQGIPRKSIALTGSEILCASTAAALVRRDVFLEIGGFDPRISVCDEDTDLSWRVWLSGYRVVYDENAIAYHSRGFERDLTLRRIYFSVRNRPYILLKNAEGFEMALGAVLFEFLSLISAVALILFGRGDQGGRVLSAVYQSGRSFPDAWQAHSQMLQRKRIKSSKLYSKGLLRRNMAATIRDISSKVSSFR